MTEGTVMTHDEIDELHRYGVTRIFTPEDGARLGLQGMINEIVTACDADPAEELPHLTQSLVATMRSRDVEGNAVEPSLGRCVWVPTRPGRVCDRLARRSSGRRSR